MKSMMELLKILGKNWNFDKRNEVYREALEEWENVQIEKVNEEGNELIIRIATINLMISKLRTEKHRRIGTELHYLELLTEFKNKETYSQFTSKLADELADYIIVEDQFNVEFLEKVLARIIYKLNRLEKRVQKAQKEREGGK